MLLISHVLQIRSDNLGPNDAFHKYAGQRPSAAKALRDPYFTEARDEATAAMLRHQVQEAVAFAEEQRRRQEAELAAFEAELGLL